MTRAWTITGLLYELAARGAHSAVIAFDQAGPRVIESGHLAADATALAFGLGQLNFAGPAALWAPNSPEWIAIALGILASGNVLVPIDDLADSTQFEAVLQSSGARLLFTTPRHLDTAKAAIGAREVRIALIGGEADSNNESWRALLQPGEIPSAPAGDATATLFWTSGTTGAAKAFPLTHANIAANVAALAELAIVGAEDRALLPLPLHHAYPFVVGALTTLTLGTSIVLPDDTSGPAILKALRDGAVTAVIGVPRLYEAMLTTIDARLAARAWPIRLLAGALIGAAGAVQRVTGMCIGRAIFAPLRRAIAPDLRLLVSGGARLDVSTENRLQAFGWTVLSGYGLAETASLFTGNRPGARRRGSVGRPLARGEIRIAAPDAAGVGEIELRGPSITAGYFANPEANQVGFSADGWFRTGDLGYLDRDGFLFVTGRTKEILVLGGGKKVDPEYLERIYGAAPQLREIAVLEQQGALVALVRPDPAKLREMGATNLRDGVRVVLGVIAQRLPSYQRLSGFALTNEPLPRTRLGKYRRFLLPQLYGRALTGHGESAAPAPSADDAALLRDPVARAVWELLQERYPAGAIHLDVNLALDLNLDSFAWIELTIALQERVGMRLSEADIAEVETIRDLLRLSMQQPGAASGVIAEKEPAIAEDINRWLAPTGWGLTLLGTVLYGINCLVMRLLFRLRVSGLENLPAKGPFVITPNHVSDLDALAIAAALPLSRLRRTYWAGDIVRLFFSAWMRLLCRAAHLFPVDEKHPGAAVRAAARVLEAGNAQVWFPEGWRSPDGRLQRFLPGIGQLLLRTHVPAVPAWIGGAFEALPRGSYIPRARRVTLDFGRPVSTEQLRREGSGRTEEECIAKGLREEVIFLAKAAGHAVEEVAA